MRYSSCPQCSKGHNFMIVLVRGGNFGAYRASAMNGKKTESRYSTILCARCLYAWRTDAQWVINLPDAPDPIETPKGFLIPGKFEGTDWQRKFIPAKRAVDGKSARRS